MPKPERNNDPVFRHIVSELARLSRRRYHSAMLELNPVSGKGEQEVFEEIVETILTAYKERISQ